MIYKYRFGTPFETDAVVADIPDESAPFSFGTLSLEEGFTYTASMEDDTALYGLGENLHGINKRGHVYVSNNTDDPFHMENKVSLYAAHNFLIITGSSPIGLFFDYPSTLTFDLGFTKADESRIHCDRADLYVYAITGESPYEIAKEFRRIIGRSYIPPKYAFGFGQSRWGYKTAQDFRDVAAGYRDHHIPPGHDLHGH